ncbi:MAG: L,D-transpeptidase [Candidatus Gracilibacteria bacterium]
MFPNFSLRSFKKSRILVAILLLCASFIVILGCLLGYRWTQLSEENQSQYTPASYGLMVIQGGIRSTLSYVVLCIHFLKGEVLQLEEPILFKTNAEEGHIQQSQNSNLSSGYIPQENTEIASDVSGDDDSGSMIPFQQEVRSALRASESAQRVLLVQKIRALEHEINFLASFYRVNHDGELSFDEVTILQSYHDIFSEENLANVSYQNLKESYESSFRVLQEYRDESERLRNIARIKRQDLVLSEKQKWGNNTPPAAPFFDIYSQVFISLLDQKMYVYEDGELVLSTPITSGRNKHETVTGVFQVYNKQRNKILKSPFPDEKYELWVDYWIAFYGAYGIHDACNKHNCWRREFGVSSYTSAGSHGCVNTPYEAVKWLYDWSKIGTTVYID